MSALIVGLPRFVGHDIATVIALGRARARNGALLRRAKDQCDVFVTVDRNLAFNSALTSCHSRMCCVRSRIACRICDRSFLLSSKRSLDCSPASQMNRGPTSRSTGPAGDML